MNANQIVAQAEIKFNSAVAHFQEELSKIRTGRAHPSMLDGVKVEVYGAEMPLVQVGSVSTPESQLLQITPFDPNSLQAISAAIRNNSSLGMNPMDDGRVVRIPIPPLTEERRREYVKLVGAKSEDAMISLRNIRHEAMGAIDKAKNNKDIGEDNAKRLQKQIDEALNKAKSEIEATTKTKEQEILTV
jgi:ribosome recycling factor